MTSFYSSVIEIEREVNMNDIVHNIFIKFQSTMVQKMHLGFIHFLQIMFQTFS